MERAVRVLENESAMVRNPLKKADHDESLPKLPHKAEGIFPLNLFKN
jgi:hypothetical protein